MSLWLLSSPYIKTSLFSVFYSKSTERAVASASDGSGAYQKHSNIRPDISQHSHQEH